MGQETQESDSKENFPNSKEHGRSNMEGELRNFHLQGSLRRTAEGLRCKEVGELIPWWEDSTAL